MATAAYRVILSNPARKSLASLPHDVQVRIGHAIASLAIDPRPHGCKKMSGSDGYRIRVGDYRIVYGIDDPNLIVRIADIDHRKDIYRP